MIHFPIKKLIIPISLLLLLLLIGVFMVWQQSHLIQKDVVEKYQNSDMKISFDYRVSPNGYTLVYSPSQFGTVASGGFEYSHIELFNTVDYEAFTKSTDAHDGPASISIRAYEADASDVQTWIRTHPESSNYNGIRNGITKATLGGVEGIRYTANGLYNDDVYVIKHNQKIYIIDGMYDHVSDQIYVDYENLVKSIRWL